MFFLWLTKVYSVFVSDTFNKLKKIKLNHQLFLN